MEFTKRYIIKTLIYLIKVNKKTAISIFKLYFAKRIKKEGEER